MRLGRALFLVAGAGLVACAQPGAPPGGPPDDAAPILLAVTPESGAVNVRASSVMLRFDEVLNERSGGGAAATAGSGLAGLVLLSPTDGKHQVRWRRDGIEIEPRQAFRPNTAYRVTLMPGLADLRGNVRRERSELVFTTGATIPEGVVSGAVFDWVGGSAASLARVELFRDDDTTFRWVTRADSTGRYALRDLPSGTYRIRAWADANNDNALGPREIFDSAHVALEQALSQDLYAFEHDTIGPRIEIVEVADSLTLRVRLDRAVAVGHVPDSAAFRLAASDSVSITIGAAVPGLALDSLRRAAAPKDSAAPPPGADAPPRVAPAPQPPADTTRAAIVVTPPPVPNRPRPVSEWAIPLAVPLKPGEYRLTLRGLPGLTGASRASERVFRIRPPPAPKDTAAKTPPPIRPPR